MVDGTKGGEGHQISEGARRALPRVAICRLLFFFDGVSTLSKKGRMSSPLEIKRITASSSMAAKLADAMEHEAVAKLGVPLESARTIKDKTLAPLKRALADYVEARTEAELDAVILACHQGAPKREKKQAEPEPEPEPVEQEPEDDKLKRKAFNKALKEFIDQHQAAEHWKSLKERAALFETWSEGAKFKLVDSKVGAVPGNVKVVGA